VPDPHLPEQFAVVPIDRVKCPSIIPTTFISPEIYRIVENERVSMKLTGAVGGYVVAPAQLAAPGIEGAKNTGARAYMDVFACDRRGDEDSAAGVNAPESIDFHSPQRHWEHCPQDAQGDRNQS
jgi:hypothetical protein